MSASEDVKVIGVYASRPAALAAQARLSDRPGFRDGPEGFSIDAYELDQDCWRDGFVTVDEEGRARADAGARAA